MENGKISVIIPVYNGVQWLRECVESILAQTYENFEVLILDDCSTDGTTQLAETLVKQDCRVRTILREKKGVSSARNQGMEETDGEYVTFVDADDKIDAQMFERLSQILNTEKSDLALCEFYRWNGEKAENGAEKSKIAEKSDDSDKKEISAKGLPKTDNNGDIPHYCTTTVTNETFLSDYFLHGYTRCWSILYRRKAIGAVRFREDLTIGEDMMFVSDLMETVQTVSLTDYRGYFYRINPNGAMLRPFVPAYMDEIKSWSLAAERIGSKYPALKARADSLVAVSAMLAAGKLSVLSGRKRRPYADSVQICRRTVKKRLQTPGAKQELPPGYGLKTRLFVACPALYLGLYHWWKRA